MATYRVLSDDQIQSFFDNGYMVIPDCVDLEVAARWVNQAYARLGYDPADPQTWTEEILWMDHWNRLPVAEVASRAWGAILDLVGGEERLEPQVMSIESRHFTTINSFEWTDAFIVNFRRGSEQPWQPPSARSRGWHKDGSYFRHFLDSREQALLPIVLWSDMRHQGGGTFVAPDSVRVVAHYLADHPEGVDPQDFRFDQLIARCSRFEEVTGRAGDVIILHPFMLHASSQNVLGVPRFMSNPPVVLHEPLNLNRDDPEEFSLLERATLQYLGVERLAFQPTRPRESFWWPAVERGA